MKKILACSAALSLMLMACGDESSSNAPVSHGDDSVLGGFSSLQEPSSYNMSVKFKGCYEKPLARSSLLREESNSKAYLVRNEDGSYQVMVPELKDYCGYSQIKFYVERVADTLKVRYDILGTACMCFSDHWFDIEAEDADIKYFELTKSCCTAGQKLLYEVVSEPIPERPSSSLDESSSSVTVPESSSVTVPESSSVDPDSSLTSESSSSGWTPKQEAKDVVAECGNGLDENATTNAEPVNNGASDVVADMTEIVDGPGGTPPVVYKYEGEDGFVTYVVDRVMLACETALTGITVTAVDDTLFADLNVDPNAPITNCICDTRVSFKIEKDDSFTRATHLVININRGHVFDIVSGTYSGDAGKAYENKVLAGKCLNDDSPAAQSARNRAMAPVTTAASAWEDLPRAVLGYSEDGFNYIQVEKIEANCGIGDATMVQELKGDTLFVDYDSSSNLLRCMCAFDELKFVVPRENSEATFFSFNGILYLIDRLQKSF